MPEIDINWQDQNSCTALHYAVMNGNVEIARQLLAMSEIDVNLQNEEPIIL